MRFFSTKPTLINSKTTENQKITKRPRFYRGLSVLKNVILPLEISVAGNSQFSISRLLR